MTFPKKTESTNFGSRFADSRAACVESTPRSVALNALSDPPKAPNGVRFAATKNTPDMMFQKVMVATRKEINASLEAENCDGKRAFASL